MRALAVIVLVAGCSTEEPPMPSGDPSAELGTGEVEFEPLADGDEIFVVQGPQGGYHLNGSVRVSGVAPGNPDDLDDPDNPTTEFRVLVGDTRVDAGGARYTQGLDPAPAEDTWQMIGRRVILDILDDDELAGMTVRFTVTVSDPFGNTASDERTLTAVKHPNNL